MNRVCARSALAPAGCRCAFTWSRCCLSCSILKSSSSCPGRSSFKKLGLFGLVEMLIFIVILLVGYVYAWKKGALEWE